MRKLILILVSLLVGVAALAAPTKFSLSGTVLDNGTGEPLSGVVLSLGEDYLWAVTDADGRFVISGADKGSYILKCSYLGYVENQSEVVVDRNVSGLEIRLQESSLALSEAVVTAKRTDGISTSHTLGRDALNHLQMSNMADMSALLPGGKTINPDLTNAQSISLRSGGISAGNAAFGTAVEVDGVRLGNNAGFGEPSGIDTRSISVDNVESIEVITGVPSAEYGDLNSGMVKVHTRKGRTPLNVVFSVNPRTYQASVSKGFDLGRDRGVVNLSGEWARATRKLSSPYESYTRRGITAGYSNTFAKVLRFEAGITGNLGGMNTVDDPDAFSGAYSKANDNVIRANTSLTWQLNRSWITNIRFEASVNYNDNLTHEHSYKSFSTQLPAVHSTYEGYYLADRLPEKYYADRIVDSKELDAAASLRYTWARRWNDIKSNLKAGVQWKASGNLGQGEYYLDNALAADGYRPRPYKDYPFMHNLSVYAEEALSFPLGETTFEMTAGLRLENVFIRGTRYKNMNTLSPRLNARWKLSEYLSIRGGWGITEKLPSFYILYPEQEYFDRQTFSVSHGDGGSSYVYYTRPYSIEYNPDLRWQRNSNSEIGIDFEKNDWRISLVGFYNVTQMPYRISARYTPFTYSIYSLPEGYVIPYSPEIRVDHQSGAVYLRGASSEAWQPMSVKVTDRSFVRTTRQENGADVYRAGAELTVETPEVRTVRTSFRLDASYTRTTNIDCAESYYYQNGWSHTSLPNRSYQFVGIYANGTGGNSVTCGRISSGMNANLTSITRIPEARLVITCRLEMSLLTRWINIPAGTRECLYPTAYLDLDGNRHPFTEREAGDPQFSQLILRPGNDYMFDQDGYGPYMSANLSITKEIGDHVSLSFFANNFTNSRPTVYSMATGVGAIFTPDFYYGLTCRLKF